MTAQIGDLYKHQNRDYTIVKKRPSTNFSPSQYGIIPESCSTCCWDGYWCVYGIKNGKFCLRELYINSRNNYYPPIEGVLPDKKRRLLGTTYVDYDGYHRYGLDMEIPYTGKILVGEGFLSEYYIHMGFQKPWAWKKLVELLFLDGRLIEVNDQSAVASQLREKLRSEEGYVKKMILHSLGAVAGDSLLDSDDIWWI